MRGKGLVLCIIGLVSRITPAYAGKSTKSAAYCFGVRGITPAYAGKSRLFYGGVLI